MLIDLMMRRNYKQSKNVVQVIKWRDSSVETYLSIHVESAPLMMMMMNVAITKLQLY